MQTEKWNEGELRWLFCGFHSLKSVTDPEVKCTECEIWWPTGDTMFVGQGVWGWGVVSVSTAGRWQEMKMRRDRDSTALNKNHQPDSDKDAAAHVGTLTQDDQEEVLLKYI